MDFYVLAAAAASARLRFACRLAEKAYRLELRVHLHTGSAAEASELDDLLWTFRQGSFVPHEMSRIGQAAGSPVTIGFGPEPDGSGDLLINLAVVGDQISTGFKRIAEIVDGSEDGRAVARDRFRLYRQHSVEPVTHNIESP